MELFDDTEISKKTKTPKWPFFAADFLLILVATFLAYRAEGISDSWYILGCLVAVMLGAVLLIVPFLLDYKYEILDRENENLDLYNQGREDLKEAIEELKRTSQSSEKQEQYFKRVEALLDAFLNRIEQPIQAMETNLKGLNAATEQMRNKQDKLLSEAEEIAGKIREAIQPEELGKTIHDILNQQQAVYSSVPQPSSEPLPTLKEVETSDTTPEASDKIEEDSEDPTGVDKKIEEIIAENNAKDDERVLEESLNSEEPIENPDDSITSEGADTSKDEQKDKDSEKEEELPEIAQPRDSSSMLSRAMGQTQVKKNQDSGVLKIIKNSKKTEELADPLENIDLKDAFDSIDEDDVKNDTEFLEKKQLAEIQNKKETSQIDQNITDSDTDANKEHSNPEEIAPEPEKLLFDVNEIEVEPSSKPKKARKGETAVIAKVLMGIGNRPYIRGNGPGLTVNKGVAMDSIKPGIWQWKTTDTEETIRCQIYKNDETPSTLGTIELIPGEQQEIEPKF